MLNRRQLIASTAATAAVGVAGQSLAQPGSPAQLNALFDAFVAEQLNLSPEGATSLGMDTGSRAAQKSQLDDRSPAGLLKQQELAGSQLARLEAFDAAALAPADVLNREIILFGLRRQVAAAGSP